MSKTINTRIVQRNDLASEWEKVKDTAKLLVGEVGIETDTGLFKIGRAKGENDLYTWGELEYANEMQVRVVASEADKGTGRKLGDMVIVEAPLYTGSTQKTRTAYVWQEVVDAEGKKTESWAALDGNYNANNVYFSEDLTTTYEFGNVTLSDGSATINSTGKNLKQVWDSIYLKEGTKITVKQPAISLSVSSNVSGEIGSTFTRPTATVSISSLGSYGYGSKDADGNFYAADKGTGVTFDTLKVGYGSAISSALAVESATETGYTSKSVSTTITSAEMPSNVIGKVGDTSYSFCAQGEHIASPRYPVSNLGNYIATGSLSGETLTATSFSSTLPYDDEGNPTALGKIVARNTTNKNALTKTATWKTTGYREGFFYGVLTTKTPASDITGKDIRNLTEVTVGSASKNRSGANYTKGSTTMTVPAGTATIVFACPKNKTGVTNIQNSTANANMNVAFGYNEDTKTWATEKVMVGGADAKTVDGVWTDGSYTEEYNVWTYSPGLPYENAATLVVTLG